MKIITAISRKGGVGKSTCLKGMAMITASKGLKTVLIDTDGNEPMMKFQTTGKELGYWADNIKAISIFEDSDSDIANILDDLEDDGVDYVFIDTKGGEGDFVALVMQAADFIIVPTGLSKDDVDGAENTIIWMQELQEAGLDIAPYEVLISNLPSASSLSVTNKEILADIQENFPLLDATIPPNKTIQNHSVYGLFHKVIEDLNKSEKRTDKFAIRHFANAMNYFGVLLEEVDKKGRVHA